MVTKILNQHFIIFRTCRCHESTLIVWLGPSIKDAHQGGLSSVDKMVLQMLTSAFFGEKNFGFFEIYGESVQTRRFEPVRAFWGQGEGVNFIAILCGRPLWTAPYVKKQAKFFEE